MDKKKKKKIVEVSVSEVLIDFALNCKCRANVGLTSLCATTSVAFKVQTSSPHKFLVNPPSGVIPPLSTITFQIILKPQPQLPSTYPRSPSDRFLVRAAEFIPELSSSFHPGESIASWLSSQPLGKTQDLKLKVAFVSALLLHHAVSCGDIDTVKKLIKRQDSIPASLSPEEARSLLREAKDSGNSFNMVKCLIESGLDVQTDEAARIGGISTQMAREFLEPEQIEQGETVLTAARHGELKKIKSLLSRGASPGLSDQYGLTTLHAAAITGHKEVVELLLDLERYRMEIECRDGEGHAPLHLAVEGGSADTVELLISRGADVNSTTTNGATPLYLARAFGYEEISRLLEKKGAVSSLLPSAFCD